MLSDLNYYLLNDLSLIVIEYVKFSDKQLSLLMNQEVVDPRSYAFIISQLPDPRSYDPYCHYIDEQCVTNEQKEKLNKSTDSFYSYHPCQEDVRLSIVFPVAFNGRQYLGSLLVNTENFAKYVEISKARIRIDVENKHSIHFHGSTIVVADDNNTFRVYDFDLDFT